MRLSTERQPYRIHVTPALLVGILLAVVASAAGPMAAVGTNAILVSSAAGSSSVVLSDNASWTAVSNDSFLHIAEGSASGAGNAVVVFAYDAFTGTGTRSGTLTVAGFTVTVTQVGTNYIGPGGLTALVSSGLNSPTGVAVDGSGNVYIADSGNNAIKEWSASTQQMTTLVSSGLNTPTGVAVDGFGNVYIADQGDNTIKEWSASNQQLTTLVSSGLNTPTGLAVDGSGNVYIADTNNNAVKEWSASTQQLTTLVSSGLRGPPGVAVDASGNVYIADQGDGAVKEWNASNQQVTTLVSSGLNNPTGVAVDGSGNVYIAVYGSGAIYEWSASTGAVTNVASSGLRNPYGVAVDAFSNVYTADYINNAVDEVPLSFAGPASVSETFAAGSDSLFPVVPSAQSLAGVYAPSSDQSWLTIGTISGGVVNFSFTTNGTTSSRSANITILQQQISVTQQAAPSAPAFTCTNNGIPLEINTAYTTTCTVTGGTGVSPFTWSISAGALPAGVTSGTTATSITLTGPATSAGAASYTVQLSDATSSTATQAFSGTIATAVAFTCSNNSVPPATGAAYTTTCTVTGGTGAPPFTWSISAGVLPTGVTSGTTDTSITLTGPATVAGAANYTIQLSDGAGGTATEAFSGTIQGSIVANWTFSNGDNIGADSSGNGYNLTQNGSGAIGFDPAALGGQGAAVFNGSNLLNLGGAFPALLPTGNSSYTITAWINPGAIGAGSYGIIGWGNYGNNDQTNAFRTDGGNGVDNYSWGDDAEYDPPDFNVYDGNFHFVAVTYDGATSNRYIYIDPATSSISVFQSNPQNTLNVQPTNFNIGRTCCAEYFVGEISQLKVFNYALTSAQVNAFNTPLAINPASIPVGTAGTPYSQTLTASGGAGPPYTWSAILNAEGGPLPEWLSFSTTSSTTAQLSGTPPTYETLSFTVTATDSGQNSVEASYDLPINVAGKVITTNVPSGVAIVNINGQQDGCCAPFSSVGQLLEYRLQPGTYTFRVIDPADALSLFPSLTTSQQNSMWTAWSNNSNQWETDYLVYAGSTEVFIGAYGNHRTGDPASAYADAGSGNGGAVTPYFNELLPMGNGTPQTTYTFTVPTTLSFAVNDSGLGDNLGGVSVLIAPSTSTPGITTGSLPAGQVGVSYTSTTLSATGGAGANSWTATGLPPGLSLSTGGTLSGTPTSAGSYSPVQITVTDSLSGLFSTTAFSISIAALSPPALSITTASPLPAGTQGTAYAGVTLAATGGSGVAANYQWASTTLPPGLSVGLTTGTIAGTPMAAGNYTNVTITVSDTVSGQSAPKTFTINIAYPALTITTASPLPAGTQGTAYPGVTLAAAGGSGSYTWTATGLPSGLSIGNSTGTIGGTPAVAGSFGVTVTVSDTVTSLTASQMFIQIVEPPPGLGAGAILVSGAAGSSSVVLSDVGDWTATSNSSFLHIGEGSSSGKGSAVVIFSYDGFTGAATRSGTLTVAGLTVTVTQAGTNYSPVTALTTLVSSGLGNPDGVAVDSSGNLYIADAGNNAIKKWTASTQAITTLLSSGLNYPGGVAVDSSGNVYIADSQNEAIKEWSASTQQVTTLVSSGLNNPYGIAVDGSGNVYIADAGNNAIKEFSPSTQTVTTLVSSGLNQPFAVAVDASGNVYIADTNNNAVKEWTASTQQVTTLVSSGLNQPYGIAVDGSGNVYVADTVDKAVKEWNVSSQQMTTLASSSLNFPFGVAVDGSGNVYFSDSANDAIYTIPLAFTGPASFSETSAAGSDSLLQVIPSTQSLTGVYAPSSDQSWLTIGTISGGVVGFSFTFNGTGSARMATITILGQQIPVTQQAASGITITTASIPNGALNQAYGPVNVAATGGSGNFVWTASGLPTGVSIGLTTGIIGGTPTVGGFSRVTVTATDTVTSVTGSQNYTMGILGITTTSLPSATVNLPFSPVTIAATGGSGTYTWTASGLPTGFSIGNSTGTIGGTATVAGSFGVTVTATDNVTSLAASQTFTQTVEPGLSLGTNAILVSAAAGSSSVVLSDGATWTATSSSPFLHIADGSASGAGSAVVAFTYDAFSGAGTRSGTLTVAGLTVTVTQAGTNYIGPGGLTALVSSGLNSPAAVAVDGSGNVYIADSGNNAIKEWNASTQAVKTLVSSGLNNPYGVAVDGSGNVYIADAGNNAIKEWSASTQQVTTLVSSGLSGPVAVAVDGSGNVYIVDDGNNAIKEFNASTQQVTTLLSTGLFNPKGVAVDAAGNVYISDGSNQLIREWNASTQQVTTLGSVSYPQTLAVDGSGNVYVVAAFQSIVEWNASTQQFATLVTGLNNPIGVAVDSSGDVYIGDTGDNAIKEIPFAFVGPASLSETFAAGSDSLLQVIPSMQSLSGVYAPSSDQSWLTIGNTSGGVVSFSFTANTTGSGRTANITILGQQIPVTQQAAPALTILTTATLPGGTINHSYGPITLAATGGSGVAANYQWTSTTLPAGLSIGLTTGTIAGTPTAAGNFTGVSVTVSDTVSGQSAPKTFSIAVAYPALTITTATLPGGTINHSYGPITLAATGGSGVAANYQWTSTTLPAGLSIGLTTGTIAGTPTAAGNFTGVSVTVSDTVSGQSAPKTFSIAVAYPALTITTASPLPGGTQGTAYAGVTLAAAGGSGVAANYQWTSTTLPAGLSLGLTTGTIAGTPTAAGNFTGVSVTVSDTVSGQSAPKTFSIAVAYPALTITTASPLPGGTQGTAYAGVTLAAAGGSGVAANYQWTSTTLPAGLSLGLTTGTIAGTPTAAGNFTGVSVTVSDTVSGQSAPKTFSIAVAYPALTITTASPLPGGTQGTAYAGVTLAAAGGSGVAANYQWTSTTLPAGLSLGLTTGTIAGTPTAAGNFTGVSVTVSDTVSGQSAPKTFSIAVAYPALTITTATLPGGTINHSYGPITLAATGGSGVAANYQWTSTTLPAGLSIGLTTGTIAGTPTAAGNFTGVSVTVSDTVSGQSAPKTFSIAVAYPALTITTASPLPGGTQGTAYAGVTLAAAGGSGVAANYQWTSTTLPAGLSLGLTTGTIAGTPTAAGNFTGVSVTVSDTVSGQSAPKTFSIAVAYPALTITTASPLPGGTQGTAYAGVTLAAAGGSGVAANYQWTSTTLPAGLSLGLTTGTIAGTPTAAGNFTGVSVTVSDTVSGQSAPKTFSIAVAYPALTITTASPLPGGTQGTAYAGVTLAAAGGSGVAANYQWTSTTLPAGLSLGLTTGTIAGTPTAAGNFTGVSVTVSDTVSGQSAPKTFSIAVAYPALTITTASPLPGGTQGTAYAGVTLAAAGGSGVAANYQWTSTTLPAGLSIGLTTGTIAGTPTAAGNFTGVSVTVSDTVSGQSAPKTFSIAVAYPALTITTATLPGGTINHSYGPITLAATGGSGVAANYQWTSTTLPAGLSIGLTTGTIAGTPTAAGNFTGVSVTVSDTVSGQSAPKTFSIAVAYPALTITTASPLPGGTQGTAYAGVTLAAAGGSGVAANYQWTSTTLPAGLSLGLTTGTIAGTPTAAGNFTGVSVTVSDTVSGQSAPKTFSIAVAYPALTITTASPLPGGTQGTAYAGVTLSAAGGSGVAANYQWTSTTLPAGLSIGLTTGTIAGTPTAAGNFTGVSVTVSDTVSGQSAPKTFSIAVAYPALTITTASPLPGGTQGTAYAGVTLAAAGGSGVAANYQWTSTTLPAGLSLGLTTGTIAGTPTAAGNFTGVSVTVSDTVSGQSAPKTFSIAVAYPALTITTASPLPGGTQGTAYAGVTLAAAGGSGVAANYQWTSTTLPAGLSLGLTTGTIAGTPTAAGNFTGVSVTVSDTVSGQSAPKTFNIAVAYPALTITTASPLPGGTQGTAYAGVTLAAAGGSGVAANYQWTSTTLPAGLSLGLTTGTIAGTPTAAGNFTGVSVTVSDTVSGQSAPKTFSIAVAYPALTITTASPLPGGTQGTAYAGVTLSAAGGSGVAANYQWTSTTLPAGLSIGLTTGTIAGTPTAAGNFTGVSVTVSDTVSGQSAPKTFSIAVAYPALTITTATLPGGTINHSYGPITLAATGGSGVAANYQWTSTTLPAGLSIGLTTGTIAGTPTAAGNFTGVSVTVSDTVSGQSAPKTFSIAVAYPALTITTASPLPGGTQGTAYAGVTLAAAGGSGVAANYQWTSTTLPAGLSLGLTTGTIAGTPTAAGNFTGVSVTVSDTVSGQSAPKTFSIAVAYPALTITTASPLPGGTQGTAYAGVTLSAAGGSGVAANYQWTSTTLPAGLSIGLTTGTIAGTPTAAGNFTGVSVTVSDTVSGQSAPKTFSIAVAYPALTITTATLPGGTINHSYGPITLAATGGSGVAANYQWTSTTLPAGLSIGLTTGTIAGTPAAAGNFTGVSVTVSDTVSGQSAPKTFSIAVAYPALTITTASPLPGGTQGTAYAGVTLSAAGGSGVAANYQWTSTTLPAGLSIGLTTGTIAGTPAAAGNFTGVSVTVSDTVSGQSAPKTFSIAVAYPALTITTASPLPGGTQGTAYAGVTLSAAGGSGVAANYQWTSTTLPAGLSIGLTTGTIAGTPTAAGNFTGVSVTVSDTVSGQSAPKTFSIAVAYPALTITTASPLPGGTQGTAYAGVTLSAAGGSGVAANYQWTSTTLPAGLSIGLTTGTIAGTPTAAGNFTGVSVTVSDTVSGQSAPKTFSIAVAYPALTITTASPLPGGTQGTAYAGVTLSAAGGSGVAANYQWTSTTLPAGLSIGLTTGTIAGTPAAAGNFTGVSVTVSDTVSGQSAPKTFSIAVAYPDLKITTTNLPSGQLGESYSASLSAAGGAENYAWTSGTLPGGLGLTSAGSITGTPTAPSVALVSFTVMDGTSGQSASTSLTLTVTALPLVITGSGNADVAVGGSLALSYSASGGAPPYQWALSGAPGFSVDSSGNVGGAASQPGSVSATLTVTDSVKTSSSLPLNIAVLGMSGSFPAGTTTSLYSGSAAGVGGVPPYSYTASGIPPGLSFAGGTLSGQPKTPGTDTIGVQVTDSKGVTVSGNFQLTITGPAPTVLTIATTSLPDGPVGQPYSQSLGAVGGKPGYTWSQTGGQLPTGLSLNGSGIVLGTPTATGPYSIGVQVADSAGSQVVGTVSINIDPAPLMITNSAVFPAGQVGVDYPAQILTASGGTPPYTFGVKGALPAGLTLDTGQIDGTPSVLGDFTFIVTVADSATPPATATMGVSATIKPNTPDLSLSSVAASFSLTVGTTAAPAPNTILVSATVVSDTIDFTTSSSVPWVTAGVSSSTPGSIAVGPNSAALALSPTGSPYSGTVTVTCTTKACAGTSQTIAVALTVTAAPPQLSLGSPLLSFAALSSNPQLASMSLSILNAGGGSLAIQSVSAADGWISVGAFPATLAPGPGAAVNITANPAGLNAGYYLSSLTVASSAGSLSIPVTLLISGAPVLTLGPSGTQFSTPQGGALGNPSGSFLVGVSSGSASFVASVLPGAPWLSGGGSGSASPANPGTVSFSIDQTAVGALAAGAYYGTIEVSGSGISNSPQDFQVILSVSPATTRVVPNPQPAGLIFVSSGAALSPQVIQLFASSKTALAFQASASVTDSGGWLSVSPATGSTSAALAAPVTVTANPAGLAPGVYRGSVSFSFASAVRSVNVTLIVQNTLTGASSPAQTIPVPGTAPIGTPLAATSCADKQLVPTQTGLVSNFSAPASWPTPLSIKLVDTCGNPIGNGQIVATFSNGDPPLALSATDSANGLYSGTWTPRNTSAQLTIQAGASAPGYTTAKVQIAGQVAHNTAPVLSPNGTLDVFNPQTGAGLGPGNIVQIYGSGLANQTGSPMALPLPEQINGTSVIIGGREAPLYYVSATQINAQIPFELRPGNQYQVIVSANGALTTPQPIQLTTAVPAILQFTSGSVVAQHPDGTLVSDTSPAMPGEYVVIYLTGLGATDIAVPSGAASPSNPPANVLDTPVLTLNGTQIPTLFAGLTPGLVGLYQINFQIPETFASGAYPLLITQGGTASNQTILSVQQPAAN